MDINHKEHEGHKEKRNKCYRNYKHPLRVQQHEFLKDGRIGKSEHLLYLKTPVHSASPGLSLLLADTLSSHIPFVLFVSFVINIPLRNLFLSPQTEKEKRCLWLKAAQPDIFFRPQGNSTTHLQ